MEDIYKTIPIALTAIFGTVAMMYTAAKATPEEAKRVKAWGAKGLFLLWLCAAGGWSAYHCVGFAISIAPISRPEVALFGMHLINAAIYSALLIFELRTKPRERRKAKIKAFEDKRARLAEELLEAKIRADVAEQLARFAEMLNGGRVDGLEKGE
jgi:hypothetical protein